MTLMKRALLVTGLGLFATSLLAGSWTRENDLTGMAATTAVSMSASAMAVRMEMTRATVVPAVAPVTAGTSPPKTGCTSTRVARPFALVTLVRWDRATIWVLPTSSSLLQSRKPPQGPSRRVAARNHLGGVRAICT